MDVSVVIQHSDDSRAEAYPGYVNIFTPKYMKWQSNESVPAVAVEHHDSFETNYTAGQVEVEQIEPGKK